MVGAMPQRVQGGRATETWKNEFLSWNPEHFCGIEKLIVPDTNFWKPDIYINELTEGQDKPTVIPYFALRYDGTVIQAKPMRLVSTCTLDIYKFPFDTQTCSLSFGSFMYTERSIIMVDETDSINLTKHSKDIFVSKEDWTLVSISVSNLLEEYGGSPNFSMVRYKISIQRIPLKYVTNLVVPTVFMVLMDAFSMFIQSYEDRLTFKITMLLGFSVLLLLLNDILPNCQSPTILGIFCCASMFVMVFSIAGCALTSYIDKLSSKQYNMRKWMKIYLLKNVAPLVGVKLSIAKKDLETAIPLDIDYYNVRNTRFEFETDEEKKKSQRRVKVTQQVKLLKKILSAAAKIREHQNMPINDDDDTEPEWHIAALVIGRLTSVMYFIFMTVLFLALIIGWAT